MMRSLTNRSEPCLDVAELIEELLGIEPSLIAVPGTGARR